MKDTKVAIIDLGSNSFRLLLGEYKQGEWMNLPKKLWRTRLGARNEDGEITEEAWARGLDALREIHQLIQDFGATRIIGLATSAIREASNGEAFMEEAAEICPMEARILTGEEEAQYGFVGAVGKRLQDGRYYAIIDIGGGSTEVALGFLDEVYWSRSYPIGAVRLQACSEEDPQAIWRETQPWFDPLPIKGNFGDFVAIGGTATTLGAMDLKLASYNPEKVQDHKLTREAVELMIMDLRAMTVEERSNVPGLDPNRADIIVAGAEILTSFMDTYEIPYVLVSERDGMEGIEDSLIAKDR